jgi:hypothetical protein
MRFRHDFLTMLIAALAVLALSRYAPAQELPPAKTVWVTFTGQDAAKNLGWPTNGWPWMTNRARRMAAYYEARFGWEIGIEFKNPWGLHAAPGKPSMRLDQRSLLTAMNTDGRFDKALDVRAMSDCLGALQREGIPAGIYVGGSTSVSQFEGERLDDFLARELTELAPILAIEPSVRLSIDNSAPSPDSMPHAEKIHGFWAALATAHRGELLCEPGYKDPPNMWPQKYRLGTIATERFFNANVLKILPGFTPRDNWTPPAEIAGPIVVRHDMAASDKPWDKPNNRDDPAKVAAFVEWVEKQLAAGFEPAVNAPFFPGYGNHEAWK